MLTGVLTMGRSAPRKGRQKSSRAHTSNVAAPRFQRHRERGRLADEARDGARRAHPGHRLAPAEIRDRRDDGEDHEQDGEQTGLEARARRHDANDTTPLLDTPPTPR